ncbi:MAG TPA: hypothetical protein VMY80_10355 [Anaerolineae bacterium]|nr:hypothetical protein [Anaerolineae bacterium]
MGLSGVKVAPYMLAIVVSLTGLLFSLRAVAGATALCAALVIAIGCLRWGYAPFSTELNLPQQQALAGVDRRRAGHVPDRGWAHAG